jgi:hypothetical protein
MKKERRDGPKKLTFILKRWAEEVDILFRRRASHKKSSGRFS